MGMSIPTVGTVGYKYTVGSADKQRACEPPAFCHYFFLNYAGTEMSIRDKVRDTLYGSAADEAESERSAAGYSDLLNEADRPFAGQKRIVFCLAAEVFVVAVIILAPGYVRGLIDWPDTLIYAAAIPFAIGFFAAFTAYRIFKNDIRPDRDEPVNSGVMSGYSGYDRRQRQFAVWLVAAAGGVVNMLLLFLLLVIR
jgi:hypothetical protein